MMNDSILMILNAWPMNDLQSHRNGPKETGTHMIGSHNFTAGVKTHV